MSPQRKYLFFAIATVAASIASCSTGDITVVGSRSQRPASITASAISTAYLPMPAGVQLSGFALGASAGGYIFTRTTSATPTRPYVYASPYNAATQMAPEGSTGGLDDANDAGDIRGSLNGAGFWAHGAADWQFVYVNVGGYTAVSVASVNNARSLVGFGSINGAQRALWWADASVEPMELPLPPMSGPCTGARTLAMNNVGDIVGEVREQVVVGRKTETRVHAVIWKPASFGWQPILLADVGTENRAYDVNDVGQVAGNVNASTAVLWSPSNGVYGAAVVVSTSQGALTRVDRCGRVVGYSSASTPNKRQAWVWENGVTTQLPFPAGAVATSADAITTELRTGEGMIVGGAMPSGTQNNNASFVPVRWTIPGCA